MNNNLQPLQFYHGTSTKLNEGDSITSPASRGTVGANTGMSELHSYFSSSPGTAFGYSQTGPGAGRTSYVYNVEPTGSYEKDPNHGSLHQSFRSSAPLRIKNVHSTYNPPASQDDDYELTD